MKIKRMPILLSIIIVIIVAISGTLAWATFRMNKTAMVLTIGNINNVRIKIHPYQLNETIYPVNLYTDASYINVEVINNTIEPTTIGLYFRINTITSDATLKYAIEKSSDGTSYTLCTECGGNFGDATSDTRMYILEEEVNSGTQYYRVYIYLDGTVTNTTSIVADMELRGSLPEIPGLNFDDLVYKVHHSAVQIQGLSATNDIRYYGSDPNNYVCLDFENSNTCPDKHLYRIIGTIRNNYTGKQELKLIKANPLEDDNSNTRFAWDSNVGNDWTTSSLLTLLNTNYLNSTGAFANSGLSSQAKSLLSQATYYLGGLDDNGSTNTPDDFYHGEMGSITPWNGYIGLMYPSDYGYASSNTCYLNNSTNSCSTRNWLNSNTSEWTITKQESTNDTVYSKTDTNNVLYDTRTKTNSLKVVRPVLYLKTTTKLISGIGTETSPYLFELNVLYNILKDAALDGTYAREYTGAHQDDFLGNRSTEKIYHWYGTTEEDGIAITDMYNVVFAGYCWQMIRTTDTGGVRLLYNGIPTTNIVNGQTTYYCGPNRFGPNLEEVYQGSTTSTYTFYYSNDYVATETGNDAQYQLATPLFNLKANTITAANATNTFADIALNNPYFHNSSYSYFSTTTAGDVMYKMYGFSRIDSENTIYVLANSSNGANNIGSDYYNTQASLASVGYMYQTAYTLTHQSMLKQHTIDTGTYLIGTGLSSNGDGTFSLTGTVQEISSSNWASNYSSMGNKFACLPGFYTYDSGTGTNTCFDARTTNMADAIVYISSTSSTKFGYYPLYKYGYGIQANGNNYELVANGTTNGSLHYIYKWNSSSTTVGAVNSLNTTSGYAALSKSHYTCFNLSGICNTYYYVYTTASDRAYSILIGNGKYVSTDLTDTNNVLYEMLRVNTNNSTMKNAVDNWYSNNLYSSYDSYIDDTVYCNNRSITSFGGWDPTANNTSSNPLLFAEDTPTTNLSCTNVTDQFSVSNPNAHLTYKVALISRPETKLLNQDSAIATKATFVTLSPARYGGSGININIVSQTMGNRGSVTGSWYIRPSITLIADIACSSGTGTKTDPYVVDAPPIPAS